MRRSTSQILTTHIGSLPRPSDLLAMLVARRDEHPIDLSHFHERTREAVTDVVGRQVQAGVSIPNDGEQSKASYATYLKDRISGFEVRETDGLWAQLIGAEHKDFPEFYEKWHKIKPGQQAQKKERRACCVSPLSWRDFAELERDIANLKEAMSIHGVTEAFMTAPSPANAATINPNVFYKTHEEYRVAMADIMKREYKAITEAGLILQIDCPDLMGIFRFRSDGETIADFRKRITSNIELLNYATEEIDPGKMRIHVCCGADEAPHTQDPPLEALLDILLTARPLGITMVAANGRHEHEWTVWRDVKIPDGKIIIPGVIDSTTNIVEHPETVAERIIRYANVVGRENVIAGVDCGLMTAADSRQVVPSVAWAKLKALGDGAALATKRLWAH